jgi:hypothetical protein
VANVDYAQLMHNVNRAPVSKEVYVVTAALQMLVLNQAVRHFALLVLVFARFALKLNVN